MRPHGTASPTPAAPLPSDWRDAPDIITSEQFPSGSRRARRDVLRVRQASPGVSLPSDEGLENFREFFAHHRATFYSARNSIDRLEEWNWRMTKSHCTVEAGRCAWLDEAALAPLDGVGLTAGIQHRVGAEPRGEDSRQRFGAKLAMPQILPSSQPLCAGL